MLPEVSLEAGEVPPPSGLMLLEAEERPLEELLVEVGVTEPPSEPFPLLIEFV